MLTAMVKRMLNQRSYAVFTTWLEWVDESIESKENVGRSAIRMEQR